jgi:hypothetical protein
MNEARASNMREDIFFKRLKYSPTEARRIYNSAWVKRGFSDHPLSTDKMGAEVYLQTGYLPYEYMPVNPHTVNGWTAETNDRILDIADLLGIPLETE